MSFRDLGLTDKTIKAIEEAGIGEPTTVQEDVIPSILAGKDVFAIAPAKCGKTCAYVFPLIEIMAQHKAKNILIVTSGSQESVAVSDRFAVFNKYHEISTNGNSESEDDFEQEANVIIASPKLLSDLLDEDKIDLSQVDILVVDDINLIKKTHQLEKLEKILSVLPIKKQNIVFTNRRSKETQSVLDKILQTPEEFRINKKEGEVVQEDDATWDQTTVKTAYSAVNTNRNPLPKQVSAADKSKNTENANIKNTADNNSTNKKAKYRAESGKDAEALNLVKKYHTFGRNTPAFLLSAVELAEGD